MMLTEHRWWNTVRYHRPSQLMWRGVSVARQRLFPLLPRAYYTEADGASLVRRENPGFDEIVRRHCQLRSAGNENGSKALDGEFEFLNERRPLTRPIDWTLQSVEPVSHLWRFHLHYHEFLLDGIEDAPKVKATQLSPLVWEIIDDWIAANPLSRKGSLNDAWHPFCLSKRIAVWLMLWQVEEPPPELRVRFAASLEGQIRYLERHLEWDLRGNHLLENLRTLALVGAFFEGRETDRRLDRAVNLLEVQLAEQILPSGEHFERSPMYHAQMLSAVLDVRDAVAACRPEFSASCAAVAVRMAEFLRMMLHPDGQVASFGDSTFGETPHVATILCAADQCADEPAPDSDDAYYCDDDTANGALSQEVASSGSLHPVTATALVTRPTKANSPLKFSASKPEALARAAGAGRIRTSTPLAHASGYDFQRAAKRSRPRSRRTSAVVRGDYWKWQSGGDCLLFDAAPVGADELPAHAHCDLLTIEASIAGRRLIVDSGVYDYGDGEMRRYCRSTAAHNVLQIDAIEQCDTWSRFRMGYRGHPAGFDSGEEDGFSWCSATHDAYRRIGVQAVGRWLACREDGPWFCVDWANGDGLHTLSGRLHLSPDASVVESSPSAVLVELEGRRVEVHAFAGAEISLDEGWYCPDFGVRHRTTVLKYECTAQCPAIIGWMMHDADDLGDAELNTLSDGPVELRWRRGESVVSLFPTQLP